MSKAEKKISLFSLTAIAVGSCIGSGIFITPAESYKLLPHLRYTLIPWILGGIATLMGALTFSELGSRFPKAGGVYEYLRQGYGKMTSFLFGWITLTVINTGALAALSIAFINYINHFVPIEEGWTPVLAMSTLVIFSLINSIGVRFSGLVIGLFTSLKLLALLIIVGMAISYYNLDPTHLNTGLSQPKPNNLWGSVLIIFAGVFWSMGGWHHASYLSGEARNPSKSIPRAMLYGTLIVVVVYMLIILSYGTLAPNEVIATSKKVASSAVGHAYSWGGHFIAAVISISLLGSIAIFTMTAPRIYNAMAKDGVFFKFLGSNHKRFNTPINAIWLQTLWACILILFMDTFSELMNFVVFMDILFMSLTTFSIFIIRNRIDDSNTEPDYKMKFYPWVPIIYLGIMSSFLISKLIELRFEALFGLILLGIGVLIYRHFTRNVNHS